MMLDGVVDGQGKVWFLEVNCNPRLHPAFYAPMLSSLLPSFTSNNLAS